MAMNGQTLSAPLAYVSPVVQNSNCKCILVTWLTPYFGHINAKNRSLLSASDDSARGSASSWTVAMLRAWSNDSE
jgi:hypothetical protein